MILRRVIGVLKSRRLSRKAYFAAFLATLLIAMPLSYLLRDLLITPDGASPYYLEITVSWSFFLLLAWTPIAVKRSHDIGLSGWWVMLLWLPFPLDFKAMLLVNKYLGIGLGSGIFLPAMLIALAGLVYTLALLFMPGERAVNKWGDPCQTLQAGAA